MIKIANSKELYPYWYTADIIIDMIAETFSVHLRIEEGKEVVNIGFIPLVSEMLVPPEDRNLYMQRDLVFSKWLKEEIEFYKVLEKYRYTFGANTVNMMFRDICEKIKFYELNKVVDIKEIYKKFMGSRKVSIELPKSLIDYCNNYDIERGTE